MAEMPMPKMGDAMEEGTIVKWLKQVGDSVQEDEPIAEIETEKATVDIASLESGILTEILVKEGETVPVGAPIAMIQGKGDAAPGRPKPAAQQPESQAVPEARATPQPVARAAQPAPQPAVERGPQEAPRQERLRVSPLARRLAREEGVDLARLTGTGPGGRIVEADVRETLRAKPAEPVRPQPAPAEAPPAPRPAPAAAPQAAPPPPAEAEERDMGRIRKIIARRMTESKQTVPHFYITAEVDMKEALALRKRLNEREGLAPISITDMIVKACAIALTRVPEANASAAGDKIRYHSQVNVGIAVALEEGLIVPVLRNCQKRSLTRIAGESRPLIERARQGKATPQELSGATFTISNLGMFDVESFVAIINPPEAAILAVGTIEERPIVREGEVVISPRMKMTLSADHRVLDGAVAARFTQQLKRLLETPLDLLE